MPYTLLRAPQKALRPPRWPTPTPTPRSAPAANKQAANPLKPDRPHCPAFCFERETPMDFETLKQECLACRRCGLCETRHQRGVRPGRARRRGHCSSGEGPGAQRGRAGPALCGPQRQAAGQRTWRRSDLSRGQKTSFIANIVKCRPPQNRDPLPAESAACMPWLREQFPHAGGPRSWSAWGAIAAQQMIEPKFSVTKDHGKFFDKQGTLFMATLHPGGAFAQPPTTSRWPSATSPPCGTRSTRSAPTPTPTSSNKPLSLPARRDPGRRAAAHPGAPCHAAPFFA